MAITIVAAIAATAVAMVLEPGWSLRFERVLAWPVIALVGMLVFRAPLAALVHGRALRRFNLGPGGISGELEAEVQAERGDEALALPAGGEQIDTETALVTLGLLAQLYQFQIDFLRHLRVAANHSLTGEATREWFRDTLVQRGVTELDVEQFINFLVERELLALFDDGRYVLTELGLRFVGHLDGFWYAPKAL